MPNNNLNSRKSHHILPQANGSPSHTKIHSANVVIFNLLAEAGLKKTALKSDSPVIHFTSIVYHCGNSF